MKTNNHLTILLLLFVSLSAITTNAQQVEVDNSESIIVMSEDDIISLANTLRELKKNYTRSVSSSTANASNTKISTSEKSALEVDYLKKQIVLLETQIKEYETDKNSTIKSSAAINNTNSLNQRELNSIKQDISQLRDLISQLAIKTKSDLTVIVPSTQLITKTEIMPVVTKTKIVPTVTKAEMIPVATVIKEQIPSENKENLALKRQLDSLTVLVKNFKEVDYTKDFKTLENRIEELKKELALKEVAQPVVDENAINKYKEFTRDIYFSNNSKVLNDQSTKVVDELNEILTKNNNIDLVVKGFASNKGAALYNENLSMMRTESVKKALILKGINPLRILTEYHGIDYNAKADKARRVEISIIVR